MRLSGKLRKMLLHAVFLGLCWFSFCTASDPPDRPPGIVIRESPSFVTFVSDYAAKRFFARHILYRIRDMTYKEKCLFDDCSLKNFTVKNYIPPTSNVTFKRGIGIEWNLTGAELGLDFYFELKKTDVHERTTTVKGNAHVLLSGLSLAAEFAIGKDKDDYLLISLPNCSVDVNARYSDVNETWEGNGTKELQELFYKKIHSHLQDRVYDSVTKAMCDIATDIAGIDDRLRMHNTRNGSYFEIILDTRLVREPILDDNYIEVAFRGEFRMLGDELGASFQPSKFDLPPPKSSMVTVYISEYVINTLYEVLFKKHWLSVNITKDILPPAYSNLLDTTCETKICLGNVFPQVAAKYPNVSAKLLLTATKPPRLTYFRMFQRTFGEFDLSIVIPGVNGSEASVANLSMSISISKSAYISRHRLEGRVFDPVINITDKGSPKEFASDASRFNFVLQLIADLILLPKANYIGAVGIPLDDLIGGIRLVNTNISIIEGAVGFSSDFVYDPTPR